MGTLKKTLKTIAKWIGILLLVILGLLVIIILLIRTPWAQQKIVSYATSYASDKTGTTIDIDRLFVTFTGNVQLDGLYVEGQKRDTLLYSRSLEAGVGIRSLFSDEIRVTGVDWDGLRANVVRRQDSSFNFTFIIDAFTRSGTDTATADTSADTSSSPMGVSVGPINFSDFHVTYLDSISGIDALLRLGALSLTTDNLDLENSRYEVDELELSNTTANVVHFLKPPPSEDTTSSEMPFVSWNEVKLENIDLHYATKPDTMDARAQLGSLIVSGSELALSEDNIAVENLEFLRSQLSFRLRTATDSLNTDLQLGSLILSGSKVALSQEEYSVEKLELLSTEFRFHSQSGTDTMDADAQIGEFAISRSSFKLSEKDIAAESIELLKSDINLRLPAAKTTPDTAIAAAETDTAASETFKWPDWQVELGELLLAENNIQMDRGASSGSQGVFDPDHMAFENLGINLRDVQLRDRQASLDLENISFTERSGFHLKKLALEVQVNDEQVDLSQLQLVTNNSQFNASLQVGYENIEHFLADPMKNSRIDFRIKDPSSISVSDAFYFNDSLRYDTLVQNIAGYPIDLSGEIRGSFKDIRIDRFEVGALANSRFLLNGRVRGLPDTNDIRLDIPTLSLYITESDIALLTDTAGSGITYPKYIQLNSSMKGGVEDLQAEVMVNTPDGGIDLQGQFADLMDIPKYKGKLVVDTLDVGKIIGNPDLESLSLSLDFDGRGTEFATLQLETDFEFQKLRYKDYDYSGLELTADVEDQQANVHLGHIDENLDFDLDLEALLDEENTIADLNLNVRGADLNDLNLTGEEMKIALGLSASFEGKPSDFDSEVKMTKGIFIKSGNSYRLDSIYAALNTSDTLTVLEVASEIVEGNLKGNTSLPRLLASVQGYMRQTLSRDSVKTDSALYKGPEMQGKFAIADSPMLTEIFLPKLTRMDSIIISLDFKPSKEKLALMVDAPEIVYGDSEVQQLALDINAGHDTLQVDLGFGHFLSGPVEMHRTALNIDVTDKQGSANFAVLDDEEKEVFYTSMSVDRRGDSRVLHVNPEHLVLNRNAWTIDPDNEIAFQEAYTNFSNFVLSRNQQQLRINTDTEARELLLDFNNFEMAAIFSLLNAEQSPLAGSLNGNVRFINIVENPAFVADLTLKNLTAVGTEVGTLQLNANNRRTDHYVVDLSLKGKYIDLSSEGSYSTAGEKAKLNLGLDVNELKLALVQDFAPEQLRNVSGGISGHFDVKGPTSDLKYEGSLTFNNASFEPIMLGSNFTINNSSIKANNEAVSFQNFSIADANGDKLSIDGKVGIENPTNPSFDLQLKTNNFMALNSTEEDNELFWGKGVLSLDVDISGDMSLPKVDARASIGEGTDVTYAIPAGQAQIEERRGLVRFQDLRDTLNVLSTDEDEKSDLITGMDISAYLKVDPKARFNVIVDPQSRDRLTVAGEANLNFELKPNGNTDLSGTYRVSDGSYRLRLYEMVQKEFHLQEGSRIIWSGNPTGAALDLTAVYRTETSAVDLMAQQLSGADQATINRYKQKLPFQVLLYIDGNMEQPRISFGLDMPDDAKDAIGGSVYTRIQQVEQDENELNKQVFSLIVFNRFLPSGVGGDEGGGTSALARSSVSNLLTNQLNQLSGRYVEGVELNFDVDSYTDYQSGSAQQQTDLNISLRKSFFDDRVVIEVGSQVGVEGRRDNTAIIGDVSAEYLLTEDGRYRTRAFRKNQYQDILEGQVIIMGLGVLFNREFDTLGELMKGTDITKDDPYGEEEDDTENNNENGTKEEEEEEEEENESQK